MRFDGVNDYVYISDNDLFNVDEITIEAYFKYLGLTGNYQQIVGKLNYYWLLLSPSGDIYAEVRVNGVYYKLWGASVYHFEKYQLYHVVMRYQLGLLSVFVNGVLRATRTTENAPIDKVTAPIRIGTGYTSLSNVYWFNGDIAFIRVYNRPLSDSEIQYNYMNMNNPIKNGLILWLHWDSVDTVNNVWEDKSGNNNNGTIYGAQLVDIIKSSKTPLMLFPKYVLSNGRVNWGTEILSYPNTIETIVRGLFTLKSSRVDVATQTIFDTWKLYVEENTLKFSRNNGETIDTITTIDPNRIYHIVLAIDSNTVNIFIDGELVFSKTYTTTLNYDFYLDALSVEGNVSMLRVYAKLLTDSEVQYNYKYYTIGIYVREPLIYCDSNSIDTSAGKWYDKEQYRDGDIQSGVKEALLKTI